MMLVASILGQSAISGIGVIATEPIAEGQEVWKFAFHLDAKITKMLADSMPKHMQEFLYHHCYINHNNPHVLVICFDNARFINFSKSPNLGLSEVCDEGENRLIALRPIKVGQELTVGSETDYDYMRKMNLT